MGHRAEPGADPVPCPPGPHEPPAGGLGLSYLLAFSSSSAFLNKAKNPAPSGHLMASPVPGGVFWKPRLFTVLFRLPFRSSCLWLLLFLLLHFTFTCNLSVSGFPDGRERRLPPCLSTGTAGSLCPWPPRRAGASAAFLGHLLVLTDGRGYADPPWLVLLTGPLWTLLSHGSRRWPGVW